MANGTYGTRKPADVNINEDVEVFYYYRPTRGSESADFSTFKELSSIQVLSTCRDENGLGLSGMYNLKLPVDIFNKKGVYSIYIKPKEIDAVIVDVSTLTGNYANVRGIVITQPQELSSIGNGDLVGYRIEYLDDNGEKTGMYRIVTSNNRCEGVQTSQSVGVYDKSVRYRFNDSSNLIFCTLTPSSAMSFKANDKPSIGTVGQQIKIVNTKFNPVMLEVEMTDYNEESIATMLEGAQLRDLDHGIITTFDKDGKIYHQAAFGNIINTNRGMNTDFKLPYENEFIRSEESKLAEIKEQVNRNGQRL